MLQINGILFAIAVVCSGLAVAHIKHKPDRHWIVYSLGLFLVAIGFLLGEILLLISW